MSAQNSYTIIGKLIGSSGKKIYLGHQELMINRNMQEYLPIDSCIAVNDSFCFKGNYQEKGFFSIDTGGTHNYWFSFLRDTGTLYIRGHIDTIYKAIVEHSIENKNYKDFISKYEDRIWQMFDIAQDSAWATGERYDTVIMRVYDETKRFHKEQMLSYIERFIKQNPDNFYSAYLLVRYGFFLDSKTAKKLYRLLSKSLQMNSALQAFRVRMNIDEKKIKGGDYIIDFILKDATDKLINTKQFKGKYMILNFWASWCIPCRQEMPELISLYKKYHSSGFEIVSVSLDINKEKWLKAIKETGIPWINVSDLKGSGSVVINTYDALTIPKNVLVNKSGKIITDDLKKAEMSEILKSIFGF